MNKKELNHEKYEYDFSWLSEVIRPTLRAIKESYFNEYQMADHIQKIVENELYDLWIKWVSEEEVTMSKINPKSGDSFVIWLQKGCPIKKD